MSGGFLMDGSPHDYRSTVQWVDGLPQKSMWTGISIKKKLVLPVTTYRCMSCGYLESYART
jgi:hypothetical protein